VPLREIDRQLIDRCLRKDPGAWNDFVDRYLGLIYHVIHHVGSARSLALSPEDVEDVAAEILLGVVDDDYGVLRRFAGRSSLPTYLTVVARRTAVRELVRREREARLGHVTAPRSLAALPEDESLDEIEPLVSAEELRRILESIPEREAEVVRLYHLQHLNYRQIGKQLGIPENSVGPILARARVQLRKLAEQRAS
jgi:RNA polymerase sigma-70 factor (ECF subfamily)